MESLSPADFNFFVFAIPGFVAVWTFRYFTRSDKKGDFELLGLSFLCGLLMLGFYELIIQLGGKTIPAHLLDNPYSDGLVFSCMGFVFGFIASYLVNRKWFQRSLGWVFKKLEK